MKELLTGYLLNDKKKTLLYITIISVAIAIFLSSRGFVQGIKNNRLYLSESKNGSYHIEIKNLSIEEVNILKKDEKIKNMYSEYIFGNLETDYDGLILYREDGYSDSEKNLNKLVDGNYPTKYGEVVVNKNYLKKLNKKVGDIFNVQYYIYDEINNIIQEKKSVFQISGVIDNFSSDPNMDFILLSDTYGKSNIKNVKVNSTLITLKNYTEYQNFMSEIQKKFNLSKDIYINNELINTLNENKQLDNYNMIINILILFIFFIVLYTTLFDYLDNILEDLKNILSIGFTKKYIIVFIFTLIFSLLLLSIIPGYFIYYLISIIFKILGFEFIQIGDILQQLLSIVIFELLLVVPLLINYSFRILNSNILDIRRSTRKDSIVINKLNKVFLDNKTNFGVKEYTKLNIIRNYKNNIIILIITVLSFGFLSYIFNMYNLFEKEDYSWYHYYIPKDIMLETKNLNEINYGNQVKDTQYFSIETADEIKSLENVKDIEKHLIIDNPIFLNMNKNVRKFIEKNNELIYSTNIVEKNNKEYLALSSIMFGYDSYFDNINIDNPIILTTEIKEKFQLEKGDTIILESNNSNTNFTIVDFIKSVPIHLSYETTTSCILKNNDLQKITGIDGYNRFDITIDNKNDILTVQQLEKIGKISEIGKIRIFDKEIEELKKESRRELKSQLVVIFAMLLITLLTVGNIINENIVKRKNDIELLYVLGISKKEIDGSIIKENMFIGILSVLSTLMIQMIFYNSDSVVGNIHVKILRFIIILMTEIFVFYIFTIYGIKNCKGLDNENSNKRIN